MVHQQALSKKWKTDGNFCLKRAYKELDELKEALEQGKSPKEIALEIIDVIYFIAQVGQDKAKGVSLNETFLEKYEDNWIQKKKTEDEFGNEVRR